MAGRGRKSEEEKRFNEVLGRRIAGARMASGMTLGELAKSAGISRNALYWYEVGRTSCPPMVLQRIALALGLSVTALMPKTTNSVFLLEAAQNLIVSSAERK